jgi:hypothetical protein
LTYGSELKHLRNGASPMSIKRSLTRLESSIKRPEIRLDEIEFKAATPDELQKLKDDLQIPDAVFQNLFGDRK